MDICRDYHIFSAYLNRNLTTYLVHKKVVSAELIEKAITPNKILMKNKK
ncbi:MAG: hypothetical protein OH318_01735 [Candidatus Parvarchaeota archaeon]|nr:hypothetical protein [Candidatus Rehaiarchaeum fermentans]